ncbi:hypothetical protein E1A91_A08G178600v1 [Gossypium mustelinum]|uniref:Uncharacterized protein n=1 Tax=Gossypium mustelinum TaxID=34275 RepID=A0A5D2YDS6_GOSMU|nr:hypothetical protein E1A91_A08G178600v1 [Gossypium mustelinum]
MKKNLTPFDPRPYLPAFEIFGLSSASIQFACSLGGNQQAGVSFLVQRTGRAVPRAMFAPRTHVVDRREARR